MTALKFDSQDLEGEALILHWKQWICCDCGLDCKDRQSFERCIQHIKDSFTTEEIDEFFFSN